VLLHLTGPFAFPPADGFQWLGYTRVSYSRQGFISGFFTLPWCMTMTSARTGIFTGCTYWNPSAEWLRQRWRICQLTGLVKEVREFADLSLRQKPLHY
jgi:hypothetical protein